MLIWRCSPRAIRESAASGSPCEPGGDEHQPVVGKGGGGVDVDDQAVWHREVAEILGDLHVADHRAADEHDAAVVPRGDVDDLLDAVHVAGERRHDDALLRLADDVVEHSADLTLGRDESGHLGVGGVDEEQVDTLVAEAGETGEVGQAAVERQLVELDVTGVQYDSGVGADRDGERVRESSG